MPQKPTEKQHYLPVAYLKQFSIDPTLERKDLMIWRLDQRIHKPVPTETQCHKRFFYSATDADEAEKFFQESEGFFGQVAKRLWQRLPCRGKRDYFGLIIFMISVHIRNPAYRVDLPLSRIGAYRLLEQQVVHHVLLRGRAAVPTDDELLAVLESNWVVLILTVPESDKTLLVTSDNPSLWFTKDDSGDVHYLLLPVTPRCCAIAFDRTKIDVERTSLNESEVETLNRFQCVSMLEAVYGSSAFSPEDEQAAPELWKRRTAPSGFINETDWQMNVLRDRNALPFLQGTDAK